MRQRLSSAELIGREGELTELERLLRGAEQGECGVVLLGGEAGVGKSSLLEAFARQAADRARVLVGGCVDLGESGLPFAPVAEVLRRLVRGIGPERVPQVLGANRFELGRLVPQLSSERVTPAERMASGSQSTLFAAVLDAFEGLADERPLVVVFEDLHWGDQSTLALLNYLARNLHDARVLVVATFRTDELHRRHPLRPLVGELARELTVTRMDLTPLSRDEVAAQITAISGGEPEPTLVDEIAARSDGNPFFVEELLAEHEAQGGRGVPGTLRDVLLSPLASLPEETRSLIDVVAVVGRPVGHRLLEAVTGWQGGALSERLRPAVDRQLLVEDHEGRYRFRHALTQEAVYDELLASERATLHRAVAETLSAHRQLAAGGSENIDAELAHHWDAAHVLSQAFSSFLAAAERSQQMGAYAAGLAHYERALALWDHGHDGPTPTRVDVLLAAGDAAHRAGDYRREASHLRAALAVGDEDAPLREADLRRRRSLALSRVGDDEQAMQEVERALALTRDAPHSEQRAFALAWYSRGVSVLTGLDVAMEPARETLEVARAAGARHPEAVGLMLVGDGLSAQGRHEEGVEWLQQALAIAEDEDDTDLLTWAYHDLLVVLVSAQRHDEAEALTQRVLAWLDAGADRDVATTYVTAKVAWQLLAAGDWQRAERLLERAARHPLTGVRRIGVHETRALLRLYQGRVDAAGADLAEARRAGATADRQLCRPWYTLDAFRAALEGSPESARDCSDAALACEVVWEIDAHPLVFVVRAETDAALTAARDRRDEHLGRAREALDALRPLQAGDARAFTQRWDPARDAARAEAELSRAEAPDPGPWRRLLATETHAFWRVYDRWRLAEALLSTGDEDAAAELRRGYEEARDLGAELLGQRLEDLARRAGVSLPGVEPPDPSALDLTPRELDVLRLVARGRTNQEIARTLYIAPKTASVHLSNILAKLGVDNRVQAAAVAHQHGLDEARPASATVAGPTT